MSNVNREPLHYKLLTWYQHFNMCFEYKYKTERVVFL